MSGRAGTSDRSAMAESNNVLDETKGDQVDLERQHYMEVRYAFLEYSAYMERGIQRMKDHLNKLPPEQAERLHSSIADRKLSGMKEAIAKNQAFFDAVIEFQDRTSPFPLGHDDDAPRNSSRTSMRNVGKVNVTLHQLMRDWSEEGREERRQSYGAVLEELEKRCPIEPDQKGRRKVLVPGAGLGRLTMEIVARGYACAGNEFSYFMLIVSNFILNGIGEAEEFSLSPFIDNNCNTYCVDDLLRTVGIPDVCPTSLLEEAGNCPDFSMVAGEWLSCYEDQAATFDSIVTVFFIDTAPVVIEYVEAISRLLKDGGVWINLGPLLYHWAQSSLGEADDRYERSLELTWEEIRHVSESYGLKFVRQDRQDATYNANNRGLMKTVYNSVFSVAVKSSKSHAAQG